MVSHGSVSVVVQTSHCMVKERSLVADAYELGLVFDDHRIVTLENLKAVFPRQDGGGLAERRKMKQMQLESNPAMYVCVCEDTHSISVVSVAGGVCVM